MNPFVPVRYRVFFCRHLRMVKEKQKQTFLIRGVLYSPNDLLHCNMWSSGFRCVTEKKRGQSFFSPFITPFGSVRLHCFNVVQVNSLLPSSVHRRWSHCRTRELFSSVRKKIKNRAFHFYTSSPVIETSR